MSSYLAKGLFKITFDTQLKTALKVALWIIHEKITKGILQKLNSPDS